MNPLQNGTALELVFGKLKWNWENLQGKLCLLTDQDTREKTMCRKQYLIFMRFLFFSHFGKPGSQCMVAICISLQWSYGARICKDWRLWNGIIQNFELIALILDEFNKIGSVWIGVFFRHKFFKYNTTLTHFKNTYNDYNWSSFGVLFTNFLFWNLPEE